MAEKIIADSEEIWKFFTDKKLLDPSKIYLSGRSIGSGPATHLASKFQPKALILLSPIKSVKAAATQIAGQLAYFLYERFNNLEQAKKVNCPTLILHGMLDNMV